MFIIFFVFLFTHGKNGLNPGFWRYIIAPGGLYLLERLLRFYRASKPAVVLSCTVMDDVFALEFAKEGVVRQTQRNTVTCAPSDSRKAETGSLAFALTSLHLSASLCLSLLSSSPTLTSKDSTFSSTRRRFLRSNGQIEHAE